MDSTPAPGAAARRAGWMYLGAAAATTAAAVGLVALERPLGPLGGVLHYQIDVATPLVACALGGWMGARLLRVRPRPWAPLLAVAVMTALSKAMLVTAGLGVAGLGAAYREGRRPRGVRWLFWVFATALLALVTLEGRLFDGAVFSDAAGFIGLFAFGLGWVAQRGVVGRAALDASLVLGLTYLAASGWLLARPVDLAHWLPLKAVHTVAGLHLSAVTLAYLHQHTVEREGSWSRLGAGLGVVSTATLVLALLSGVTRVQDGGDRIAPTALHAALVIVAGLAVALHVAVALRSSRHLPRRAAPEVSPAARGAGLALAAAVGLACAVRAARERPASFETTWSPSEARARLANPRSGVLASTLSGRGLVAPRLDPDQNEPGCARTGACHELAVRTWRRSAHRFGADAAYRAAAARLVGEEGVEAARLCAACHDPSPLLSGEMLPGARYPRGETPGVTCLVCHSARATPTSPRGDGHYRLDPLPLLGRQFTSTVTASMMVYDHMPLHRSMIADAALRDDALCAACHQLTLGGHPLRTTYEEFVAAAPIDARGQRRTCRSCHMPVPPDARRELTTEHDHAMLGGNVALGDVGERVRFIAEALSLEARREPDGAVTVTLRNRGSGHGFPTAPLDLVEYWWELRDVAAGEGTWRLAGPARIFDERLYDARGALLTRHEIWRVARVEVDGPRIPVGEARRWTLPLDGTGLARAAGLEVRLRHRRYRRAFAEAIPAGVRRDEAVEILRAAVP